MDGSCVLTSRCQDNVMVTAAVVVVAEDLEEAEVAVVADLETEEEEEEAVDLVAVVVEAASERQTRIKVSS